MTLTIEARSRKVNQLKVLAMLTKCLNLKSIWHRCTHILVTGNSKSRSAPKGGGDNVIAVAVGVVI